MNQEQINEIKQKAIALNRQLIDGGYGYHRFVNIGEFVVEGADPLNKNPQITVYQKIEEQK